ncbi:UNVERIFIED_CONTAM: hypothetical protein K2H54_013665, partial [Gekko kuhli]
HPCLHLILVSLENGDRKAKRGTVEKEVNPDHMAPQVNQGHLDLQGSRVLLGRQGPQVHVACQETWAYLEILADQEMVDKKETRVILGRRGNQEHLAGQVIQDLLENRGYLARFEMEKEVKEDHPAYLGPLDTKETEAPPAFLASRETEALQELDSLDSLVPEVRRAYKASLDNPVKMVCQEIQVKGDLQENRMSAVTVPLDHLGCLECQDSRVTKAPQAHLAEKDRLERRNSRFSVLQEIHEKAALLLLQVTAEPIVPD